MRIHRRLFVPALARAALIVFVAAFAPAAQAKDDFDKLDADEGLLLLVVDNGIGASSIRIDGPGLFSDDLAKVGHGVNVRLMRFLAGEYRWTKVNRPQMLGYSYFNLSDDPDFAFRVEPGVINYPGDLLMQRIAANYSLFSRTNRTSLAMARLDRMHPDVRARFAWRTEAKAPDPFPAFLAAKVAPDRLPALSDSADADAKKVLEREVPEDFRALFDDLYTVGSVDSPRLNPTGRTVAYVRSNGGKSDVVAVDLASGESLKLFNLEGSIEDLEWGDDRTLVIGYRTAPVWVMTKLGAVDIKRGSGVQLVRFGTGPLSAKSIEHVRIPEANLIDAVPGDASRLIVELTDTFGESHVYALDKRMREFKTSHLTKRARIDDGLNDALGVFPDRSGRLIAAIVAQGKGDAAVRVLMSRRGGEWKAVRRMPEDEYLVPYMLDADGAHLVALTNIGREQVDIVRLSLDTGEIGETIVSTPGVDIVAPILRRRDHAVLGSIVYRGGMPQMSYLTQSNGRATEAIVANFPDSQAMLWDESLDGNRAIVRVYSETNPGTFYLYDATTRKLEKLLDARPALAVAKPAASKRFTVRSRDGLEIEAFLTLPPGGAGPHPLVVMPHGGPIGVADTRTFSPTVQVLVNRGFAVLRVNYRGSSGAGKSFMEAGHGKWGRQIEEDVELALDHALANHPLDRGRVALFGASYGGYSTLMGLVRAPERFRCGVAVSAVTDLPLLFSSSDWNRSKASVAQMKKIVGDPDTALDELREYSPDYQFARLTQPLLLVHGTDDARVSFEHAWRLRTLLANAGRPPAWLPLPGADHSLSRPKDRLALQAAADGFLRECLKPGPPTAATAAAAGGKAD